MASPKCKDLDTTTIVDDIIQLAGLNRSATESLLTPVVEQALKTTSSCFEHVVIQKVATSLSASPNARFFTSLDQLVLKHRGLIELSKLSMSEKYSEVTRDGYIDWQEFNRMSIPNARLVIEGLIAQNKNRPVGNFPGFLSALISGHPDGDALLLEHLSCFSRF